MSYYSEASLVMIPSGVKDGKVYSAKPVDGSGDLTFSRGADIEATRVNSQGYIEKAKVNLLLQSNTFSTSWTISNASITGGQADKDGGTSAWKLEATTNSPQIQQSISAGGVTTYSVYAKAGTNDWIRLLVVGSTNYARYFNLSNGTKGSSVYSTEIDSNIVSVGGGWYRVDITTNSTITAVRIFTADGDGTQSTTSSGYIYIQDAQLNYGLVAQDYVETTTAAVVTGITNDMPRLNYDPANPTCPSLLLEPSATAINQDSEYFSGSYWTKGDLTVEQNTSETLDPSGNYSASKLTETATTARHRLLSGTVTMSAVNNTSSVFLKKGTARYGFVTMSGAATSTIVVDLEDGTITSTSTSGTIVAQKVENYGGGWYRISVTALGIAASTSANLQFGSAGSATPSYTANIPSFAGSTSNYLYAWGANLTNTGYLQSYLPTYGTSATRTADACSKTGISSLIGSSAGTIYAEIEKKTSGYWYLTISDSSTNNWVFIGQDLEKIRGYVRGGAVTTVDLFSSNLPNGTYKIALGYSANNVSLYVNGALIGTDTTATMPTGLSAIYLTAAGSMGGAQNIAAELKQYIIFPTRLSSADLATLTSL